MKFGSENKGLTGGTLALYIWQLCALLPLLYVVGCAVQLLDATRGGGFFGWLFGVGVCAMPRAEALALSLAYRLTAHEAVVCLAPALLALIVGLFLVKPLKCGGKTARLTRVAIVALWTVDLLAGLLPLAVNTVFGWEAALPGMAIRLACLALTAADLIADRRTK